MNSKLLIRQPGATVLLALALLPWAVDLKAADSKSGSSSTAMPVFYRNAKVEGLDIFYREAGATNAPLILLLHGFPSSSHMFRDLIPMLADRYHVIAPDYPGFGYSTQPDRAQFSYTFDHLYHIVDKFTRVVGAEKFAIYIQDYGSPIGLRFALYQPERITAIIVQNGNAYEAGLTPLWDPIKAYWAENTPQRREACRNFLKEATTKFQYSEGVPVDRRNPDAWRFDQAGLDRPGNEEIQLDLFSDYRNNVKLYPDFQESFRKHRFPTLIVWGKNDPIFSVAGAESFKQDLPKAEIHYLEAGHFAIETHASEIAGFVQDFMPRALNANPASSPQPSGSGSSQQTGDGNTREFLERYTNEAGEEFILELVTIPPLGSIPPHTHPVVGHNYVVQGVAESQYEGREMRVLRVGDHYQDEIGVTHKIFRNPSRTEPLKFLIAFTIRKGGKFVVLQ